MRYTVALIITDEESKKLDAYVNQDEAFKDWFGCSKRTEIEGNAVTYLLDHVKDRYGYIDKLDSYLDKVDNATFQYQVMMDDRWEMYVNQGIYEDGI
ncbi:hypothetical protein [Geomicrobium sp. JCM 19055]|uniref:hypothetical protein n=1 Tax=Geomicrobium sp. JCM 19055 TaxID=1460649 RepID=UPI0005A61422|nr:hypothetical protein [Geomicrobium sp. JCM 19055]